MSAYSLSKKADWLTIKNVFNSAEPDEILITGEIGGSWWDDSGTTEATFLEALKAIPENKPVVVGINSEGGSIKDGLGIYNALRRRNGVTTRNDGWAVSIASVLMLAGEKRISPKASIWMIHEPWSIAQGDANDMLKAAEMLDKHGETIADIYADRTGLSTEEAREKMKAETWFKGDEAVAMGFATESTDTAVALNSIKHEPFRNIPKDVYQLLAAAAKTDPSNASDIQPVTAAAASLSKPKEGEEPTAGLPPAQPKENQSMSEPTTTPAPAAQPAAEPVNAPVALSPESVAAIASAVASAARPEPVAALPPKVTVVGDAYDRMLEAKPGNDRLAIVTNQWNDISKAGINRGVWNLNTVAAGLTTNMLSDTVLTSLGSRLAVIKSFFTEVLTDPVKPKAKVEVALTSGGSAILTNPTDWESGDTTIDAVEVTVNEYAKSYHATNAQLQSGTQMAWMAKKNAMIFAEGLTDALTAILTQANYGAPVLTSAAAAFGSSDMATIWAGAKDFTLRNLVLDGGHYARLIPTSAEGLQPTGGSYGFDSINYNNKWSASAIANICGFVASPECAVVAIGLPIQAPGLDYQFSAMQTVAIPDLGFSVQVSAWAKPGTRALWAAYDVMLGVAKADGNAAKLITSA